MTSASHNTDDPSLVQLVQFALHAQGLLVRVDGIWGPVSEAAFEAYRDANRYAGIGKLTLTLSAGQQDDLAVFLKNWKNPDSLAKYQLVSAIAQVPAELVAALHYRECPDFPAFGTYLQNGDPLGAPTTHAPAGILFSSWTTAAVNAIARETTALAASGVEEQTRELAPLCVFAEAYNGEGYRTRGVPDPYVLAGTSGYTSGKFTGDGVYDPAAVDAECGVLVLLRAILPTNPL